MKHTVGFNNIPKRRQKNYLKKADYYRNRFVASEGHDDWEILQLLVNRGFMACTKPKEALGGSIMFYLTNSGLNAIKTL